MHKKVKIRKGIKISLSLLQSNILRHTQQLGLEVHLDELKTGDKTLIARKYLRCVFVDVKIILQ